MRNGHHPDHLGQGMHLETKGPRNASKRQHTGGEVKVLQRGQTPQGHVRGGARGDLPRGLGKRRGQDAGRERQHGLQGLEGPQQGASG
jgi:hypothetical protein